jgi:hypothetical protein
MQKSFDVTGPVELDIRIPSGDIEIDPSLDGRVDVELIAHDEESEALVANARIELDLSRGSRPQLLIELPKRRGGGFSLGSLFNRSGISCTVRCPSDSGVSLRSKSADLTARGTIGGLNVATASGDIEVDRVTGGVNVKSASADFTAREIGGGGSIHSASGDIDIEIARGPLNLNSVSGDVSVSEAWDSVNANTVSGDQDHGAVLRGKVTTVAVSGDITIGVRRGSRAYLDCSTVSGDTSSELEVGAAEPEGDGPFVEIRAKTVSGDINITRAPAPMDTQEVHA